jgi:hypothetical protein
MHSWFDSASVAIAVVALLCAGLAWLVLGRARTRKDRQRTALGANHRQRRASSATSIPQLAAPSSSLKTTSERGHDVFICHSAKDRAAVDAIAAALTRANVTSWIASNDIEAGASWGEAIIEAINGAKLMLVLVTPNSNSSREGSRTRRQQRHRDCSRAVAGDHAFRRTRVLPQRSPMDRRFPASHRASP